jgi:cytidyltransferase-like protein
MAIKQHHRACTFGRFNLLHNGHVRLFEEMADTADYLTIGLSTAKSNLPYEMRKEVIELALADTGIAFSVVPASHPFELFEQVAELGNDDVVAIFGTDQFSLCEAANRHYGWSSGTVERLTSSTAVRVHIDREEWDILASLTVPRTISHLINLRKLELTKDA